MTAKLNVEAVEFARELIEKGKYRINTVWSRNEPTSDQAAEYLKQAGDNEYYKWFLAVAGASPQDALYPFGDFRSVHRSGLKAIQERAELNGQGDIAAAARELLDLIDHFNAC